jgi:alpha-L-rhamnosidase
MDTNKKTHRFDAGSSLKGEFTMRVVFLQGKQPIHLGLLACLALSFSAAAQFGIDDLRCDGRENPMGVDRVAPMLSWKLIDETRGSSQSACQVVVSTAPDFVEALWNSGRVDSPSQQMRYGGAALASVQRVYWRVRVWDGDEKASPWSPTAQWSMGLLSESDWQGRWISAPERASALEKAHWIWSAETEGLNAPPGACLFRRRFDVKPDTALQSAYLELCADNRFTVFVNGRKKAEGERYDFLYRVVIADVLEAGGNVIAIRAQNDAEYPNPAGVLAELTLEYADGSVESMLSDTTWRCLPAPKVGWNRVDYDDGDWPAARVVGDYGMEPWGKPKAASRRPLPIFRREFDAGEKPIEKAHLFVCGLGHFELFLNGEKVGNHVLDPGWTNYRKTCLYVPFDVSSMLRPGKNVVGLMLGNGMYNVAGGRYTKFTGSFGAPKLIAQMHIQYEDGTHEILASDKTWKTSPGPITFSCIYGGEDYDARLEKPGWDQPGFDDGAWSAVREVAGPGGVLQAQNAPPLIVEKTLLPVSLERTGDAAYAVDLGENLSARPFLKVQGKAGQQVRIEVAERPNMPWEGHSYTYTLRGEGVEVFRPRFTYFGFQYLYVQGAEQEPANGAPQLLQVGADFITSASEPVGAFKCNLPLFNDIDDMIDRSVRSNLQHVLTDCPHREKLGWLEVAHLMGPSIFYRYDARNLYRKICQDTTESQLESGMVPDIAPEYTRFSAGFFESAEWGSASVQLPWLLYRWYGDDEVLSRQYDTMAKYTRYLADTRNAQGLAKAGLGDWYDWSPEKGHVGYSQWTPGELTATAMLFDNARILAKTAQLLGRDDAVPFRALAEEVRGDFIAAYFEREKNTVASGSQSALSVGLYFDLVPEEARDAVLASLVEAVESMQYRPTTGEVCFRYMILALAEAGRSDVVYRIINRTDAPGYGCMLTQFGLKTLSERWDKPGSSLNHCMFGHIQEWFQAYVLGIQQGPDSLGWERVRIAPVPTGDLNEASGHYDSPRGRIAVSWKKTGEAFEMVVTIPANVEAELIWPGTGDAGRLSESGRSLLKASGIRKVDDENGVCVIRLGGGTYHLKG